MMEVEPEMSFNEKEAIAYEQNSDEDSVCEQIKRKRSYPLCIIDSDSNSDNENNISKNKMEKSPDDVFPDVAEMVQKLLQSRDPSISPLQCSECDLECPSHQALEFHTKLHVMERIVQRSYAHPEIGLRKPSKEKKDKHKDEAEDIETIMSSLVSREDRDVPRPRRASGYGKRLHKCEECGVRYKLLKNLKKHMRTHTGEQLSEDEDEKTFICTVCGSSFTSKTKLKAHMVEHSDKRPFKCEECTSNFKTQEYLEAHRLLHLTQKNFPATFDRWPQESKNDLKLPMDKHPDQNGQNDFGVFSENKKMKKILKAKNNLKKRVDKPSAKRPFKCKECNSRFKTSHYLEAHKLLHGTYKKFACTLCEYKCEKKARLTHHMLKHTGLKNHACPLCNYRCNEKGNLAKHMVIHGDDKPFSCPEEGCDYKCKLKCNLKNHMVRHTGEKRYACNLCDYKSIDKNGLNTHKFNHSGMKPFPCSVCGKGFASKTNLNVHLRTHTNNKPFACHLCDYRDYTKSRVNRHMLRHTGEKPYKCEECGSRFKRTGNLKKHMRKVHGLFGKLVVAPTKLPNNLQYHPEVSNSSSQPPQTFYQENAQSLNNQHIVGASSITSRTAEPLNNHHIMGANSIMGRNTQSLNNQHIIGASSLMGRNIQETTHQAVNYSQVGWHGLGYNFGF